MKKYTQTHTIRSETQTRIAINCSLPSATARASRNPPDPTALRSGAALAHLAFSAGCLRSPASGDCGHIIPARPPPVLSASTSGWLSTPRRRTAPQAGTSSPPHPVARAAGDASSEPPPLGPAVSPPSRRSGRPQVPYAPESLLY
jgi:hypothetical protein